ncbi:hypothetical protein D3C72_1856200 [compost metagenome]
MQISGDHYCLTKLVFFLILALHQLLGRLAHLGTNHTARIQGDVEFKRNAALGNIIPIVRATHGFTAAFSIGDHCIKGGGEPGLALQQGVFRRHYRKLTG